MGIVRRNDLFATDPDNPNNPNRPAVKNAGKVVNPDLIKNEFSNMTSMVPSKPTPIAINFDATGKPIYDPRNFALNQQAAYETGYGSNDLLSKLYYGIDPKNTEGKGVGGPTTITKTTGGTTGGTTGASTGTSSSAGMTAEQALALAKFNYDKEKDDKKLAGLSALQNNFGAGFNALLNMITEQGKTTEAQTQSAYNTATSNVNAGYDAAKGLGAEGYNALNTYLKSNPNNPYAGMTAQTGTPADAMSKFLQAYGVDDTPVKAQVQADVLQSQQGAGNFQNLINTLGAIAQQGDASRGAESQMAQNLFNTSLGQERAGYQTQVENARTQALAALQKAMFESRFSVEQNRNTMAQQLAQTVAELGGTSTPGPAVTPPPTVTPPPDPRLVNGQLPTAGNMYEGPGLQGVIPPVYPTFNTDIANMPAAEQRAALDRIESYTPETFAQDSTEEQRKALQQLLASMGLG